MKRLVALAGPLLIALMMAAPARAAVLETLTVQASALEVTKGNVTLKEGSEYTLKASGTFDNVGPEGVGNSYDALFCIDSIGQSTNTCADHHRGENFRVRTGSGFFKDIDAFGGPIQTFRSDQVYTVTFSPPETGVLQAGMHIARTNCTTCQTRASGAITIVISGPGGGGSGGSGPAAQTNAVDAARPTCVTGVRAIFSASKRYCPFGKVGILPPPQDVEASNVSSAPLKPNTKELDASFSAQDMALLEEFVAVAVRAHRARQEQLNYGCLVLAVRNGASFARIADDVDLDGGCAFLLYYLGLPKANARQASARSSATGCRATFVPLWRKTPSAAQNRAARADLKSQVRASCKMQGGQIDLKLRAPAGRTLNQALGKQARTAFGRTTPDGQSDGENARLAFSWGFAAGG